MTSALIGYTGFVGSNLDRQMRFTARYNSANISEIRGKTYDLVVCAGIRAEKWLANKSPERDWARIRDLLENIKKVNAGRFIHVSTIDVYENSGEGDENTPINPDHCQPYGRHRYRAEILLRELFKDLIILRLPALFGPGLKKNFVFDLLNPVPRVIFPEKFWEILDKVGAADKKLLKSCYRMDAQFNLIPGLHKEALSTLHKILDQVGFTSLNFTHHKSAFQYYPLRRLKSDLEIVLNHNIQLQNLVTEPLPSDELAREVFELEFLNITDKPPLQYNLKSIHHRLWNNQEGYVYSKAQILDWLADFRANYRI